MAEADSTEAEGSMAGAAVPMVEEEGADRPAASAQCGLWLGKGDRELFLK